jgi:hypothetical protein
LRTGLFALLLCGLGCRPNEPLESAPVQPVQPAVEKISVSPSEKPVMPLVENASPMPSQQHEIDLQTQTGESLARGLAWLLAQQAEDGGWHSQTYGPFKGGAATTSLVLYAASRLPPVVRQRHRAAWRKGWKFLETGVRIKGFVVCPDGTLDEPVYATALVLIAARTLELNIEPARIESLQNFLWQERCATERGFQRSDLNYGGWDLAGGSGLRGETPGSNISITRFAVEALLPYESRSPELVPDALAWAARVQNLPGDGGFFFHPDRANEGNKAQWADGDLREQPRSYGTATCDGVLLLAELGLNDKDPRLQAGLAWLAQYPDDYDRVPGFEDAPPEGGWQQGLLYYYLMTSAQALADSDASGDRRASIVEKLLATQHEDGHWRNESARMREDDPLIATCFAIVALGGASSVDEITSAPVCKLISIRDLWPFINF